MAEYNTRDLRMAISAAPEGTYGAILMDAADVYRGMLTTGRNPMLPDIEKADDTGKVGRGQEFPTEQRSGYIVPPSIEITEDINTEILALLIRRGMGGTPALAGSQPAGGTAVAHTWGLKNTSGGGSRQLPSSSVSWSVGGADYLWGGMVVETLRVDQAGGANPTATVTLVGNGSNKRIRDITTPPTFPVPATMHYMFGPDTQVGFTIGGTPYSLYNSARLTNFSLTLANNHRTDDRRPGDPAIDATNPRRGWYTNRMLFGDRTLGAEMTVMLDETLTEVTAAQTDLVVTNFYFRMRGDIIGATAHRYTVEFIFPKCYFRNVRAGDDGGNAVVTMGIFPVDDGVTSPMICNVINGAGTTVAAYT